MRYEQNKVTTMAAPQIRISQLVLFTLLSAVYTQGCFDECMCQGEEMTCEGISVIPPQQENITMYIFSACTLNNLLSQPLPYTKAKVLQIFTSNVQGLSVNAFENMQDIEQIEINLSTIDRIENDTFLNNPKLTVIKLINNKITDIQPGVFRKDNLPVLQTLHIGSNNVKNLNFLEEMSETLTELDIEDCGIHDFSPDMFKPFPYLKRLDIGKNHIHVITDQFSRLPKLERLYVYHSMVSSIDQESFTELKMLQFLDLENNNLKELAEDTFEGPKSTLKTLLLKKNNLTTLSEGLLAWDLMTSVDLRENPWNCDCDISWMGELDYTSIPLCATPEEYKGQNLFNVTAGLLNDEQCSSGGLGTTALVIIIILLIGCTFLLAFLVYKCVMSNKRQAATSGTQYSAVYQQTNEPKKKGMLVTENA